MIGKATKHISNDFRKKHSSIPWSIMAGMRNVLIYEYVNVDLKTVWKVAIERLPELAVLMQPMD